MNIRLMLAFVALMVLAALPCSANAQDKPNVLVIISDDAGYADFGFQGSKTIPTPNFDALAARGIAFHHHDLGRAVVFKIQEARGQILEHTGVGQADHQRAAPCAVAHSHPQCAPFHVVAQHRVRIARRRFGVFRRDDNRGSRRDIGQQERGKKHRQPGHGPAHGSDLPLGHLDDQPVERELNHALILSSSVGGQNAAMVLKRWNP